MDSKPRKRSYLVSIQAVLDVTVRATSRAEAREKALHEVERGGGLPDPEPGISIVTGEVISCEEA